MRVLEKIERNSKVEEGLGVRRSDVVLAKPRRKEPKTIFNVKNSGSSRKPASPEKECGTNSPTQ